MPTRAFSVVAITALTVLGLAGCTNTSPEAQAFQACEEYVTSGAASNDDVSEYCMETSKGSGETTPEGVSAIRELITTYNQHVGESEQIKVDF